MFRNESVGGLGEAVQQDEAVTRLSHSKMLRRVREMNTLAAVERVGAGFTLDDILQDITEAKEEHRAFLQDVKRARALQSKDLARRARLLDRKPFPHPRPWNDSPLLDPERERMTPEAIAGDALLEFQETKRARREQAAKHPSWKYPNIDRAFGEPPLYCCTNSFKRVLEGHLMQAVARISQKYEAMDEGTLRLSNLKADVGAELWLMQSSLEEVQRGLKAERQKQRLEELARGDHLEKATKQREGRAGRNENSVDAVDAPSGATATVSFM